MELYIFRARRLAVQYLAVRRIHRGLAVLVVLVFGAVIYSQLQYKKSTVSAVGCKSKVAQVATFGVLIFLVMPPALGSWVVKLPED